MSNKIAKARKVMCKAFKKDPDFRYGYLANIAMCIHDSQAPKVIPEQSKPLNMKKVEDCNIVADRIINLVFGK